MKTTWSSIPVALAICVFAGAAPAAAGNGGDAVGMKEQAQIHPNEVNQDPAFSAGFVAEGEVYPPGVTSDGHFVRTRFASATALAPSASSCHMYQSDYGGWWFTACGPE